MIKDAVIVNHKEFKQALDLYLRLTKKTMADAINEKMVNVAFKSAQYTEPTGPKSAASAKIRAEIIGLPITKDTGVKRYGDTKFVGGYKLMNWQRKNSGLVPRGNKFGRRSAKGRLRKFISHRAKSAKWIRIGWSQAAQAFGKKFTRGKFDEALNKRLGGGTPAKPASIVEAEIFNNAGRYDVRYKPNKTRNPSGAMEVGKPGLIKGIQAEIKNMYIYIIPRLAKDWYGIKGKIKAV